MRRQFIVRAVITAALSMAIGIGAALTATATQARPTHTTGVYITGWCPNEDSLWNDAEADQCQLIIEPVR